jgi:hypothetical protein
MEDSSENQKRRPSLIAALVIEGAERGVDAIIEEQRTMSKPNCFLELERRKKREYTPVPPVHPLCLFSSIFRKSVHRSSICSLVPGYHMSRHRLTGSPKRPRFLIAGNAFRFSVESAAATTATRCFNWARKRCPTRVRHLFLVVGHGDAN